MKKVFLLLFILMACIDCALSQNTGLLARPGLKPAKKLTAADSLRSRNGVVYFNAPAIKGSYNLSIDQSSVRFLYGTLYNNAKDNYVQMSVRLTNASADTLKYLSMSCSWWDIYRTDNEKLKVFASDLCYKNDPVVCTIPPYQSVDKDIVLLLPKRFKRSVIFKVGMMIQKHLDNINYNTRVKLKLLASVNEFVIWSNYISVSQWDAITMRCY